MVVTDYPPHLNSPSRLSYPLIFSEDIQMSLQSQHIQHITTWQASGLTQADYCRQNGLNAKTFSRWFRLSEAHNQPLSLPALVPIKIIQDETVPAFGGIRLQLKQGHTVDLPITLSPIWLAELLQCLD
jgi:hypothetical protein